MMIEAILTPSTRAQGPRIYLKMPFDPALNATVKRIGGKFDRTSKRWWLHDTVLTRRTLLRVFGEELTGLPPVVKSPAAACAAVYELPRYLMQHQARDVKRAKVEDRWGFFNDTGTGKTLIGIEIAKMLRVKTVVICPKRLIRNAWIDDLEKWGAGELRFASLRDTKPKDIEKTIQASDVLLINFESFAKHAQALIDGGVRMLMIDESSKIKGEKSKITKDVLAFAEHMDHCYLFSGTPAPNTELEYFSQIACLAPELFGKSYYTFRSEFFNPYGFGGFQWRMKPERRAEFKALLAKCSSSVSKSDVLDLPERVFCVRDVELSAEEKRVYEEMRLKLIAEIECSAGAPSDGEESMKVEAYNAAVKLMKLRQVTSGFIMDENGAVHEFGRSKLDALLDLLEEIGQHQAIIWTQFIHEAAQIHNELGERSVVCNGSARNEATLQEAIDAFKSGAAQYLIAHPRTLAHGVTLVNCTYSIDYSQSYSYEEYHQKNDRIYRKGQRNACTYYSLQVPKSVDVAAFMAVSDKRANAEEMLDYIKHSKI